MINSSHRLVVLLFALAGLNALADEEYYYSELPPQRYEFMEYVVIPSEPVAQNQGEFPEVGVDSISDFNPDPKNYYRQLQAGDFDSEAMYEVLPRSLPGMQLPEPTIIPAGPIGSPPVNTIPAQRIAKIEPDGEELIFQQLTPEAQNNADLGIQSLLSRQPLNTAATPPEPATKRRVLNPPTVSISDQ